MRWVAETMQLLNEALFWIPESFWLDELPPPTGGLACEDKGLIQEFTHTLSLSLTPSLSLTFSLV